MNRRGATVDRDSVTRSCDRGPGTFKSGDVRPLRKCPASENRGYRSDLVVADLRSGYRNFHGLLGMVLSNGSDLRHPLR